MARPKSDTCRHGHDLTNPKNVIEFTEKIKRKDGTIKLVESRRCRLCQYAGQHRSYRDSHPLLLAQRVKEENDPSIAYYRESIDRAEVHQRRREEKAATADIDRELRQLYPGVKEYPGILEAPFVYRLLDGCLDVDPDLKQHNIRKAISDSFGKLPCGRLFSFDDDGRFSTFTTIEHIKACPVCDSYFKPKPSNGKSEPVKSNVDFGPVEPSNVDFGLIEPAKSQPSNVDFS